MIELKNVMKEFNDGGETFVALKNTSLEIGQNEFVAVVGPSGSGKSTFLTIMGALQKPTEGTLLFRDRDVYEMSDDERSDLRFDSIGFILQGSNLIPFLTIKEQYQLKLKEQPKEESEKRIREVLKLLSIENTADKYPDNISGGERQRAAIGLAILLKPRLVLADEPTASLDTKRAVKIVEVLREISREDGTSVVMVTHDERMLKYCDRVIEIVDGDVREKQQAEQL